MKVSAMWKLRQLFRRPRRPCMKQAQFLFCTASLSLPPDDGDGCYDDVFVIVAVVIVTALIAVVVAVVAEDVVVLMRQVLAKEVLE